MIKVFHDIINGVPKYYVSEEIEYEKGFRTFHRMSGTYNTEKEAEVCLRIILKKGNNNNARKD